MGLFARWNSHPHSPGSWQKITEQSWVSSCPWIIGADGWLVGERVGVRALTPVDDPHGGIEDVGGEDGEIEQREAGARDRRREGVVEVDGGGGGQGDRLDVVFGIQGVGASGCTGSAVADFAKFIMIDSTMISARYYGYIIRYWRV